MDRWGGGQTWHVERLIPEAQRKTVAVASTSHSLQDESSPRIYNACMTNPGLTSL